MGRSYQIALLQLHELVDAHVFSYIVVVCEYAFAVYCALEYVSIELNLTVTEGRIIPPSSILQPLWRVYRWDVFDRACQAILGIFLVYCVMSVTITSSPRYVKFSRALATATHALPPR